MISEGLEGKILSEVFGLEKLSDSMTLPDMSQLNEPLDKLSCLQGGDSLGTNTLGYPEKVDSKTMEDGGDWNDSVSGLPHIAPFPTYEPIPGTGFSKVTDIFGNTRICDPNTVDIFSGLPQNFPDNMFGELNVGQKDTSAASGITFTSRDQWKLDNAKQIEAIIYTAVEHYKDAKSRGDIEEMLKWEAEANKQQGQLYNVLGISGYTLNPKAPGIY